MSENLPQLELDAEVDELASRVFVRHTIGSPCPLRGGVPVRFAWTNHARAGVVNECHGCTEDPDSPASVGESLRRLEAKRTAEAKARARRGRRGRLSRRRQQ